MTNKYAHSNDMHMKQRRERKLKKGEKKKEKM